MCRKKTLILGLILILSISIVACQNNNTLLSEAEAKKLALEHFKLGEDEVNFNKFKKELDDGLEVFEMEFQTENENFEIELNAKTGEVLSYERDGIKSTGSSDSPSKDLLSEADAKDIALDYFKLDSSEANFTKFEKDFDDGIEAYEIKLTSDREKFKIKIDALDGSVIKSEKKPLDLGASPADSNKDVLSEAEAKKIILDRIPGADESHFVKFKSDIDNGKLKYEGELLYKGLEYEFEMDAKTGEIIEWEIDD